MTSSPVRRRPRGSYLVPLVLLALLLAGAPAAANQGGQQLTVMTRNLYLGAALEPLFPQPPIDTTEELVAAATQVWHQVLATDFATRAEALAEEIAAERPMLVGLQEVTLYRVDPLDPTTEATTVRLDFLAHAAGGAGRARAALPRRGRAGVVRRGDSGARLAALRRRDRPAGRRAPHRPRRDPRRARRDQGGRLDFGRLRGRAGAPRARAAVAHRARVDRRGRALPRRFHRFINTHLEAFHPGIAAMQAGELLAGPAATSQPVILVGDFNSPPEPPPFSAAYKLIAAAGFTDVAVGGRPTCCFDANVADPAAPLTTRIDLIWYRGPYTTLEVDRIGDETISDTPPVWASDHAGLVAVLLGTKT